MITTSSSCPAPRSRLAYLQLRLLYNPLNSDFEDSRGCCRSIESSWRSHNCYYGIQLATNIRLDMSFLNNAPVGVAAPLLAPLGMYFDTWEYVLSGIGSWR
jgi:hypothetical protein